MPSLPSPDSRLRSAELAASLTSHDVAVVGSGFAGSLMSLVLERMGRRCVLIERGAHPRFAIGESSTPVANLVLEQLCRQYDLPSLMPFTKYGRWQTAYPTIGCGLKRGFSFFKHCAGQVFQPSADHVNELLVGANPDEDRADTHWFREEVDHFFVGEVQAAGIPYFDRTNIRAINHDNGWRLTCQRGDEEFVVNAALLIDATGPGGLLCRSLGVSTEPAQLRTDSWSIYSHFTGVDLWEDVLNELGATTGDYPYPCDAAALHHVLEDGWMWVLRFNNGVTSAGIAFDGVKRPYSPDGDAEAEWRSALRDYPSIARQFAAATPIRPWTRVGRMQRCATQIAGADWALLPHAAYFFDPLFSAGNAHTLLGIRRLAEIIGRSNSGTEVAEQLAGYERTLKREITFLDWLIHGCYTTFDQFDKLGGYVMYYFAGAIQSEMILTGESARGDQGFLFSNFEPFRRAVESCYQRLGSLSAADLYRRVADDIAAYNPAGLCDLVKRNMYPFV